MAIVSKRASFLRCILASSWPKTSGLKGCLNLSRCQQRQPDEQAAAAQHSGHAGIERARIGQRWRFRFCGSTVLGSQGN